MNSRHGKGVLAVFLATAFFLFLPLPEARADDCGCVGATRTFRWGDTITEDCVLNCDLDIPSIDAGNCFTVGADGITIDGGSFRIRSNWYYYGIDVTGRSNVTIRNIEIDNFNTGIHIENSTGIEVSTSAIVNNRWWQGIVIANSSGCLVTDNFFENNGGSSSSPNGGAAIRVRGASSSGNVISHNYIVENDMGIQVYLGAADTEITRNIVTDNRFGILIENAPGTYLALNRACSNVNYDIWNANLQASGANNYCANTINYDDAGATGCAFGCWVEPNWNLDYNGDGVSDIAVFRPSSGLWAVRGVTRAYFGTSGDTPVPGDYNADGTTDIAVFRPASGLWAVRGVTRAYFGTSGDNPVSGDYSGDGTWDQGIFRPTSGLWAVRGVTRVYFGSGIDLPAPGYYGGPGKKFIGIFRPASGLWAVRGVTRVYFGGSTDTPVPGDYEGDGFWRPGIFRPASGMWAVRGITRAYFGTVGDVPLPAAYGGAHIDQIAVFRPATGLWAQRWTTRIYFGALGDIPVTR